MTKKYFLILIVFASFIFNGCETDFSLNADYQVIPVVVGLLDHAESTHYIKITRTFLGDGNNYDFAKEPDSSYFQTVDAKVIEYYLYGEKKGEKTGEEWQLHDTIIPNKESGTFYAPNQKVYVFYTDSLREDMEYHLVADLDEGKYKVHAKTTMMEGFKFSPTLLMPGFMVNFASSGTGDNKKYNNQPIGYTTAKNASNYKIKLRFHWKETYSNDTESNFYKDWVKDDITVDNYSNNSNAIQLFSGSDFYQFILSNISQDNSVTKREFLNMDIIVTMAHFELAKYMEVSKPSSSIAQVKPLYSNITYNEDESGLGIFSSRHNAVLLNLKLNSKTIEELCSGQVTGILGFCSNLPEHSTKYYYCD